MISQTPTTVASPGSDAPTLFVAQLGAARLHLGFLDGMRGLAAFQVVCFHFIGLHLDGQSRAIRRLFCWTQFGHFAVDLFIVLSGFCLMLPYARANADAPRGASAKRAPTANPGAFFKRRAWRILPAYYAALLLSLGAVLLNHRLRGLPVGVDARDVWTHLLLIHNCFPQWHSSLNVALWSVATEWQIYFLFPFVLLPVWARWGNAGVVVAGFAIGLGLRFLAWDGHLDGACPWYVGLFAMGMAGAVHAFAARPAAWTRQPCLLMGALGAAILYVGAKFVQPDATSGGVNIQWIKDVLGGGVAWCLIVYCTRQVGASALAVASPALAEDSSPAEPDRRVSAAFSARAQSGAEAVSATPRTGTPPASGCEAAQPLSGLAGLFSAPLLTRLGLFSYSLYLVHGVVLEVLEGEAARRHLNPSLHLLCLLGVGIPCALAFAWLFFRLVEQPALARRAAA